MNSAIPRFENWQTRKLQQSYEHQDAAVKAGINELVITSRKDKAVTLTDGRILTEFMSCSYLGLETDPRLITAMQNAGARFGVQFAAARTRMRTSTSDELEDALQPIFCGYYPTLFSTVTLAHLGFLPLLASGELPGVEFAANGPHFVMDRIAHSSLQINRSMLSQFGSLEMADFSDVEIIKKLCARAVSRNQTSVLISDGVGSMRGLAPVQELIQITEQCSGYLYLDDAHGVSTQGKHGCGYVLSQMHSTPHPRIMLALSLAKAFGVNGGVLALPTAQMSRFAKRFASTYIFGGPVFTGVIDAALASAQIHLSEEIVELQKRLWENVDFFDRLFGIASLNYGLKSPLRGIFIGDELRNVRIAQKLQYDGFAVTAAMYPTVARGKAILRVALSAIHSENDIFQLHQSYVKALKTENNEQR